MPTARPAPHPTLRYGHFEFYGDAYNLWEAADIIRRSPRTPIQVDIATWHPLLRKPRARKHHLSIGVSVDWNRIDGLVEDEYPIDLSVPLFVATVSVKYRQYLVFDGWHRIGLAWRRGIPSLPGYLFTATETRRIVDAERRRVLGD